MEVIETMLIKKSAQEFVNGTGQMSQSLPNQFCTFVFPKGSSSHLYLREEGVKQQMYTVLIPAFSYFPGLVNWKKAELTSKLNHHVHN